MAWTQATRDRGKLLRNPLPEIVPEMELVEEAGKSKKKLGLRFTAFCRGALTIPISQASCPTILVEREHIPDALPRCEIGCPYQPAFILHH